MDISNRKPNIDFWIVPDRWPRELKEILKVQREVVVNGRIFTVYNLEAPKRLAPGERAAKVTFLKGPVAVGNFHVRLSGRDLHGPHFELIVNDVWNLMDFEHDQIVEKIVCDADKFLYPEEYALVI